MRGYSTGESTTRLYSIWQNMKNRCYNLNNNRYQHYGAKGITVFQEWLNDFSKFKEWAIVNGYSDNLVLDRINNSLGYFPNNLRWVTYAQSNLNYSRNRLEAYNGITKTLKEWSEDPLCVVSYKVLQLRVNRGMKFEEALFTTLDEAESIRRKKVCLATQNRTIGNKLDIEQVLEIRRKFSSNLATRVELALEYNVSRGMIDKIISFERWKDAA